MNTKRWYRRPSIVMGASLLIALCAWSIAQPGPSVLPEGPPSAPGMQGEAGLPPAPPNGELPPPRELRDNEAPPQRAQSNDERYGRGPGGPGGPGPRGQFGPGQGRGPERWDEAGQGGPGPRGQFGPGEGRGGERWNEAGQAGPGPRGQFGPGQGRGGERWDEAGQAGPGPRGQFGPGQGRGGERWDEAGQGGPGPRGQFGPGQGRRGGCDMQDGRQGPVPPGQPHRVMGIRLDPDTIFNEIDTDNSGTISREEFRAMHESRRPPMAPPAPDAPGMVPPGEPVGPPPVR